MRERSLRLVSVAGAVCLLGAWTAMLAGAAAAATEGDAARPLDVDVLGIDADGLDQFFGLAGLPHRVEVVVRVTNTGTRIEGDVVARVDTEASMAATMPVDLAPGEAVTRVVPAKVSGPPGAADAIVVSAGDTRVAIAHRQVPWLLVGAAALGLHVLALGVRDRLREQVARTGGFASDQPSPSQTWARSSRYSDTS